MAAPGASSETLVKGAPTAAEHQSATQALDPRGSHVTAIGPSRGFSLRLGELWAYRELFYFLMWRDLKVRYKRTAIGASWAIVQPLMTMIVFTVFFGTLAKLPSDNLPYPIFSFTGLLPWTMFVYALNNSSMSVVASQGLITKVYFPRIVVPLASALAGIVDFLIGLVVLAGMMAYYHVVPPLAVLTLPLFTLFALATALAFGLWFSALNVRYRDVQLLVPFLIQIWLFLTPIAYSTSLVPPAYRLIYGINPMAGVVEGFRWALLGRASGFGPLLGVSVGVVLVVLVSGIYYFRRTERLFADII